MSLDWWQKNIIYHIYLPSFKDGNNDGIGDFKGLISKMDYFKEIGISSLLLSPFYPSPMKDNGYDISSFTEINPMFGTMDDFDDLMRTLKDRNMNIVIDFVANHTSDQHPWFRKSVMKEYPYTDYFIWADPSPDSSEDSPFPPNNWLSVFNGSAWTWNEQRKQFYFHQFLPEQPDLNYRNPHVLEESKDILRFWLNKGVDGFRVDAASHLFEEESLLDEPLAKNSKVEKDQYSYLDHIYTKGHKENLNLLEEWKRVLDEYTERTRKSKVMLVEALEKIEEVMFYYGTFERKIADIPMNFQFYKVKPNFTGLELQKVLEDWIKAMPRGKYSNWVMSSHDDPRVVTRVGSVLANSLMMVMMLLPGIPIWYYGDELGMENGTISPENLKDTFALRTVPSNSRDPMRTPMQWDVGKNAGFTDSDNPFLPVNKTYQQINVEVEKGNPYSFLNYFKKLLRIRQKPSILFSCLEFPIVNEKVFSILRPMVDAKCYLLILNMSSESLTVNMATISTTLPSEADIELTNCEKYYNTEQNLLNPEAAASAKIQSSSSVKIESAGAACADPVPSTSQEVESDELSNIYKPSKVPLNAIHLGPHQAIILSYIG